MTHMTRKIHAQDDLVSGLMGKNAIMELISGIFILPSLNGRLKIRKIHKIVFSHLGEKLASSGRATFWLN